MKNYIHTTMTRIDTVNAQLKTVKAFKVVCVASGETLIITTKGSKAIAHRDNHEESTIKAIKEWEEVLN